METFNELATVNAVALLVSLARGSLNYTAALKLIYFADRTALARYGSSITGGTYCSMNGHDLFVGLRTDFTWCRLKCVDDFRGNPGRG